jgi:hypothetical protein
MGTNTLPTIKQMTTIELIYPTLTNKEISELTGVSINTINFWARRQGWRKTEGHRDNVMICRKKTIDAPVEKVNYWDKVKQFKQEQFLTYGKNHPFYLPTKKIYGTDNTNRTTPVGTDGEVTG